MPTSVASVDAALPTEAPTDAGFLLGDDEAEPAPSEPTRLRMRVTAHTSDCPGYDVDLYPDGSVQFYGESGVNERGPKVAKVRPADALALYERLLDSGFFRVKTLGPCDAHDPVWGEWAPSAQVSLVQQGVRRAQSFGPTSPCLQAPLREGIEAIERVAGITQWLRCDYAGSCRDR
ncbi:MAG: hypothetical protein KF819_14115 [Labilithrix sp.]|nr:hypothetical protein [Labilithrix sp.]